ncbi:MAG: hypothetical protein ACLP05_11290 [Candidatus Kryptoniota bacterium]
MKNRPALFIIPSAGYAGLWLLGGAAFLIYFRIYNVSMGSDDVEMIRKIPSLLAILTVPVCTFVSFVVTGKVVFSKLARDIRKGMVNQTAGFCVLFTVAMDLLITVLIQRMDILLFPLNLMYLFAWLIIFPSVVVAGRRSPRIQENH